MADNDLGQMPEPTTEEPELIPGGTDALVEHPDDDGLGRDLDPDANPAVNEEVPDEISEADDKPQAPEGEADDAESDTTTDDPEAGQTAEDGSAEPPA